ncbi:MAG: beta-lactamase family protein [Bacteroidia bacterium]|nr:beta-lactamase family protein [Bacteroidia bacterium]
MFQSNIRSWIFAISLLLIFQISYAQDGPLPYEMDAIRSIESMLDSKGDPPLLSFIERSMIPDPLRDQGEMMQKLREIRKDMMGLRDDIAVEAEDYGLRLIMASADKEKHLKVVLDRKAKAIADLELLETPKLMLLTLDNLKSTFDQLESDGMSGLVYVKTNGEVQMRHAFGMANRDLNASNTISTVFGVGSRPIDFTVAGIFLLDQNGAINIKDRINKYFDNVPNDKKSMTIEHLMTGQSGLPDFFHTDEDWDPDLQWIDRNTAVRRLLSQELLFAPGTGREHSHGAFGLLAALIEQVSGITYYDFLKKHFFDPAGMQRTGEYGTTLGLKVSDFAAGGGPQKIGMPNIPPNWGPTSWLVKGSGGMYSTLEDLLLFYDYVRSGPVLDKDHSHYFHRATVNLDGSDRGFELFNAYESPDAEVYLFLNEMGDRDKLRQLMRALERLVLSE